ncbi:MAG: M50 family metallopeptidase, partial [Acidobacteriota bacterium]
MVESNEARLVLLASVIVTALLYVVPGGRMVSYPLLLLSTLAHELGHGVAAWMVGGSFERFMMAPDGSGVAFSRIADNRLARAVVAAGGLVGPAVVAALFFVFGRTMQGARWTLTLTVVALSIFLVLVVRGWFSVVFVMVVIGLGGAVIAWASPRILQLVLIFVAVQLSLAVFSRGDYLFTPTAQTAQGPMPSDVGQMAQALFLPYWFWGLVCGGFSVAVL